jgi:hypothetical protein
MNSILNSKVATGGAVARNGFDYQDSYALVNLPHWLAQDAFAEFISEAVGDLEVCYFTPAGVKRVFHEAKNHVLTSTKFWDEVEQFKTAFDQGGGVYERFVLVAPGMPSPLAPVLNLLDRIRGVGAGSGGGPLADDARKEFVQRIVGEGKTASLAEFILERVWFQEFDAAAVQERFAGEMLKALPAFDALPSGRVRSVQEKFDALVRRSFRQGVKRAELEHAILDVLSENERATWSERPSQLWLIKSDAEAGTSSAYALTLDARTFVGPERVTAGNASWSEFHARAVQAGAFLQASRPRRRVVLSSELRMSAAIVVGNAFKAARGHVLTLKHREAVYDLSKHDQVAGVFFSTEQYGDSGTDAVVSIEIGPATDDVKLACGALGLDSLPTLRMWAAAGLPDLATLNKAIAEARQHLAQFRGAKSPQVIHLFVKGPSFFAMALGHRLNGLCHVQLYDWSGSGYAPTALLLSSS